MGYMQISVRCFDTSLGCLLPSKGCALPSNGYLLPSKGYLHIFAPKRQNLPQNPQNTLPTPIPAAKNSPRQKACHEAHLNRIHAVGKREHTRLRRVVCGVAPQTALHNMTHPTVTLYGVTKLTARHRQPHAGRVRSPKIQLHQSGLKPAAQPPSTAALPPNPRPSSLLQVGQT